MNWREEINNQLSGVSTVVVRQMNIDALPRVMQYFEEHQENCKQCQECFAQLRLRVYDFSTVLENHDSMKKFEVLLSQSEKHLKSDHRVYFKGYWSAWSVLVLLILGGSLGYFFKVDGQELQSVMLGVAGGMILGYIIGRIIESSLIRKNRLL